MIALSHKSKQYGLIALKVLILSLTFAYIYQKIAKEAVTLSEFSKSIRLDAWGSLILFFTLAAINWILEILKWQAVVSTVRRLFFLESAKQSLAALTVSLATPNRIGDYGAKAYFYEAALRKKILLLNMFSNGAQMLVTVFFGVFGMAYILSRLEVSISVVQLSAGIAVFVLLGILGYAFRRKTLLIKGFTLAAVWKFFKNLPNHIQIKTIAFSLLRYMVFSTLFYLLIQFFGADIAILEAAPLIFAMYFLASVVPMIFVFDVVVKGGIAVWLFSLVGIPEWPILCAVFAMWLLNFVFPAVWGSFYVLTYKKA